MKGKTKKVLLALLTLAIILTLITAMPLLTVALTAEINVENLDVTDLDNVAGDAAWHYDAATKRLNLSEPDGEYTLTGTNGELNVSLSGADAILILDEADITASDGERDHAITLSYNNTIKLIGDNFLTGLNHGISPSPGISLTITSEVGGSLTVKTTYNYGIVTMGNFTLNIAGDADVTFESENSDGMDHQGAGVSQLVNVAAGAKLTAKGGNDGIRIFDTGVGNVFTLNVEEYGTAEFYGSGHDGISNLTTLKITGGGTVLAKGVTNGISVSTSLGDLFIDDADVTAEGGSTYAPVYSVRNIKMNDAAKLTMKNNSANAYTNVFEKINATSALYWKVTNLTLSGCSDTSAVITTSLAAGATGTVERGIPLLVPAAAIAGVTSPADGVAPSTSITNGANFTAELAWDTSDAEFIAGEDYTATITLTANAGYTFSGSYSNTAEIAGFTVNTKAPVLLSNNGQKLVFTVTFEETPGVPGTYNTADLAAMNAIIDAHPGLAGLKKASASQLADGNSCPRNWLESGWGVVYWSSDASNKRIIQLNLRGWEDDLDGIFDASGLTALTWLNISDNQFTEVDVTGLTGLVYLNISNNKITTLSSLAGMSVLEYLNVSWNDLTTLPGLSALTSLNTLVCSGNQLTSLPALPANLVRLYCTENNLTDLDLSGQTSLEILMCQYNNLTSLILPTSLLRVACHSNELTELDVTGLVSLTMLYCDLNRMVDMNGLEDPTLVEGIGDTAWTEWGDGYFRFSPQKVTGLFNADDIAAINAIIDNNGLRWQKGPADGSYIPNSWRVSWESDLVATSNKRVIGLNVGDWGLTGALDLSELTALEWLDASENELDSINLAGLVNLYHADLNYSGLSGALDMSGLTALEWLDASWNELTSVNLAGLINLCHVDLSYNELTGALDMSGLTALERLNVGHNQLTSIIVAGLTDLEYLNASNNDLTSIPDLSGLISLKSLYVQDNNLTALPSLPASLEKLMCQHNMIEAIDVSALTNLETLYCEYNLLASLKLSVSLKEVQCQNNDLTSLDATGLTNLWRLYCEENYMTTGGADDPDLVLNIEDATAFSAWGTGHFRFSPQKTGAPLVFANSASFNVPAGYVNNAITPIDVSVGVSGGVSPYYFWIEDGPSWLAIDEDTGVISGTRPATSQAATTATIGVEDADGVCKYITIDVGAVSTSSGGGFIGGGGGGGSAAVTVYFNTNGGNAISSQSVMIGGKATKPTDPTKAGFVFAGWYTDAALANAYDFSKVVTSGFTLYAKWTVDGINIKLTIGKLSYTVGGVAKTLDVAPYIVDGRTMVPLRFVAEALGAKVDWDGDTETATATLGGKVLSVKIGALAPGMDVPAVIKDGRTMAPLRFICEFFGCKVEWNPETATIVITK